MNFPLQLEIGSVKVLLHPLLETLGIFTGFRYFLFLRDRQTDIIDTGNRVWIIIAAIFGAIFGSRLTGGLENPPALFSSGNMLYYFYENKTVAGGFLGGLFSVELVKKIIGEKRQSGDLFVFPIILALIIGRFGCFSMGIYEETYGSPTAMFTGTDLGDGVARHPVTLYEILFLAMLWIFLVKLESKTQFVNGARFKLFMIFYLLFRFLTDFIKPHYTFPAGLSTIQFTCLLGLLYYAPFIFQPKKLTAAHYA